MVHILDKFLHVVKLEETGNTYLIVFIFPLKCIWTNNSFCKMADHMDHSSWPRDQSAASSLVCTRPAALQKYEAGAAAGWPQL